MNGTGQIKSHCPFSSLFLVTFVVKYILSVHKWKPITFPLIEKEQHSALCSLESFKDQP